jgi:hypothetical protein
MKVVNETEQALFYTVTGGGSIDCGNIDANGDVDLPYYDNQTNVTVSVTPDGKGYYTLNIPDTGTGGAATIGFYFE